jgi:quinohemoprotein ethanol dehydrogenase
MWWVPGGGNLDGGVVTTASNLVVQTTPQGHLMGYTADKGEKVLDITLPLTSGVGPPMTYLLDGKQYIAVMAGQGAVGGRGGGGGGGRGNRGRGEATQEPTAAAAQGANVPPTPAPPQAGQAAPAAPAPSKPRLFVYTLDAAGAQR